MKSTKTAIVVGTGAGSAMMARELQGRYQVTLLEAGGTFKPFTLPVNKLAGLRKTGLFLDERMIQPLLPAMRVAKTSGGGASANTVMVWGRGVGGTTTLATDIMDWILSVLVRAVAAFARLRIGGCAVWKPGKKIRLLLVGYNGARNTGSDRACGCAGPADHRSFRGRQRKDHCDDAGQGGADGGTLTRMWTCANSALCCCGIYMLKKR